MLLAALPACSGLCCPAPAGRRSQSLGTVRHVPLRAPAAALLLSLRGGGDGDGDGEAAAAEAETQEGAPADGGEDGRATKANGGDVYDKNSENDEDSNAWDYSKFGLSKPVLEEGLSLNEGMTGAEGEPGYLAADHFIGKWGWTGMHRAACEGDESTLRKMLEMGGDANAETKNGWTPLIEAASEGHTACVKTLLEFGANVTRSNKGGWTPLHFACGNAHLDTIAELLAHGADARCQDSYGDYPMDKALRNAEMTYPTLPQHRNISLKPAQRREIYFAAAALVNVSEHRAMLGEAHESDYYTDHSRFSLYAELLPGRRYAYDLDFEAEGEEHQDGTADKFYGREEFAGDDANLLADIHEDDANLLADVHEAQESAVRAYNESALNEILMRKMLEGDEPEAPATMRQDGVLDDEVEELISRWRDQEYEQRLAQGILPHPSEGNGDEETPSPELPASDGGRDALAAGFDGMHSTEGD